MKILLSSLLVLAAGSVSAQTATAPLILEEFYGQKISPNGKFLYSDAGTGEVLLYNLETNEWHPFYDESLGHGNSLTNEGIAVGTSGGHAAILKDGEAIRLSGFSRYPYGNVHGITYDGNRVTGVVGNPRNTGTDDNANQMYLPFVADIDADGNCSGPVILPYPDKDFFGLSPQYCSATWISRDGKTILGQIIDYSGMFLQPIIYRENEAGEWSYSLPTESMFNPENIELPEFPGEFDYSLEPNALEFMNPDQREEYLEDYDWWTGEGNFDQDLYPDPVNYMSDENVEKYLDAYNAYVDYIYEYNEMANVYYEARNAIFDTSISFVKSAMTMNAEGTMAALTSKESVVDSFEPKEKYGTCLIDLTDDSVQLLATKYDDIYPEQILKDGTILGATPTSAYVASYVYVPGEEDYIPVEDYFTRNNPLAAEWMKENLMHDLYVDNGGGVQPYAVGTRLSMLSGLGAASEDFSVFAGSVTAYMFHDTLYYLTYVFHDLQTTGVKVLTADNTYSVKGMADGTIDIMGEITDLCIYDLSGRKVLDMPKAEGRVNTGLKPGIYVVSYIDGNGKYMSQKINF